MSNYASPYGTEKVREDEFYDSEGFEGGYAQESVYEVKCNVCKGSGLVWVHDQETDCIDCEGFGSVVV